MLQWCRSVSKNFQGEGRQGKEGKEERKAEGGRHCKGMENLIVLIMLDITL